MKNLAGKQTQEKPYSQEKHLDYIFATTTNHPEEFKSSLNLFASARRTPTKKFLR